MKCTIPEISWHNREPVLSVDIQSATNNDNNKDSEPFWRLATGGADSHVLVKQNPSNNINSRLHEINRPYFPTDLARNS